jgi:hypothetical protein
MYRELQRWALIITIVIFIFATLAAFVPQWIIVQPYARAYGLRQMCTAGYCGAMNWAELYTHPQCKNGCWGSGLIARFHTVEAFLWIAAGSLLLAAIIIASGFHRDLIHTARIMGPVIFFLTLAWISYIIALSVFGSTLDMHSYGASCPFIEGCFYWGPSSITAYVGLALSFLGWLLALLSICTCNARQRGVLLAWAFLFSIAALGFTLGSVLSQKWVIRSLPFSNLKNGWSFGPINACFDGHCGALSQVFVLNTSCKGFPQDPFQQQNNLRALLGTGVAFLVAAMITSIIAFVVAWMNWPMRTFIVLVLTLIFLIVGTSIISQTFDWWLGCENGSYCDFVSLVYGFDCTSGFAYASAIVATLLAAILVAAFIIMFACRKEDRAPDTTQVAVTTIAQPPAVPVGPRGTAVPVRA